MRTPAQRVSGRGLGSAVQKCIVAAGGEVTRVTLTRPHNGVAGIEQLHLNVRRGLAEAVTENGYARHLGAPRTAFDIDPFAGAAREDVAADNGVAGSSKGNARAIVITLTTGVVIMVEISVRGD